MWWASAAGCGRGGVTRWGERGSATSVDRRARLGRRYATLSLKFTSSSSALPLYLHFERCRSQGELWKFEDRVSVGISIMRVLLSPGYGVTVVSFGTTLLVS